MQIYDEDVPSHWENRRAQEVLLDLQAGMKKQASWWLTDSQGDEATVSDEEFPLAVLCEAQASDGGEDDDELLPPPPPSGEDADDVFVEATLATKKQTAMLTMCECYEIKLCVRESMDSMSASPALAGPYSVGGLVGKT